MLDFDWIVRNSDKIWGLVQEHLVLSYVPILIGLAVAIPVGIGAARWSWLNPLVIVGSSTFFAIPSLALFVFMLPVTGISHITALLPLSIYSAALLVRNVVEGIKSTDETVRQAATAMGYRRIHRLVAVELPNAVPVIIGGLRVATVANIGMASVVSVIGISSLGDLFIDGTQRFFMTPIVVGIVLTLVIAAASDFLLIGAQRVLTPWARRAK